MILVDFIWFQLVLKIIDMYDSTFSVVLKFWKWMINLESHPKKKLYYQDPRGSAKTMFLDSLSAYKDMQLHGWNCRFLIL